MTGDAARSDKHDRPSGLMIYVDGDPPDRWIDAFRARFPDRSISWGEGTGAVDTTTSTAVVWRPFPGLLGRYPNLTRIVSVGVATDHLRRDPSFPADVEVLRRSDPDSRRAMAEFVLMQALVHHRGLIDSLQDRPARRWEQRPRGPLSACRISVLGYGPMGQASAALLQTFGCTVTAWSRTPKPAAEVEVRSGWPALDGMFAAPDLLVNILPPAPETHQIIDRRRLALLPRGAALINVGRGDAVDQAALLECLDVGHLSLAALDVLPREPPDADDPVWTHPRVVLTPHSASLPIPHALATWLAPTIAAHR